MVIFATLYFFHALSQFSCNGVSVDGAVCDAQDEFSSGDNVSPFSGSAHFNL